MNSSSNFFRDDLKEALSQPDQWLYLGWHDIKSKYRRTKLGPTWIVLVNLVTVLCFSVVGATLFKQDMRSFLPHVTVGLFVWYYIAAILSDSCIVYNSQAPLLQNLNTNQLTLCLRLFVRNTIAFMHSFVVIILVLIFLLSDYSFEMLYAFFALPIYMLTALALSIIFGTFATRFRDVGHIVQSIVTIFPFVTPLIWKVEMLGDRQYIADFNPVTHYVALMRDPLLGNPIKMQTYLITLGITAIMLLFSAALYNKYRYRIVYWL